MRAFDIQAALFPCDWRFCDTPKENGLNDASMQAPAGTDELVPIIRIFEEGRSMLQLHGRMIGRTTAGAARFGAPYVKDGHHPILVPISNGRQPKVSELAGGIDVAGIYPQDGDAENYNSLVKVSVYASVS